MRADRRPSHHNGGPIDAPFGSAKADTSALLEREGGAAGRPFHRNGGAMRADGEGPSIGPPLLMLLLNCAHL